jgi:hypothetical protein
MHTGIDADRDRRESRTLKASKNQHPTKKKEKKEEKKKGKEKKANIAGKEWNKVSTSYARPSNRSK